MSRENLELVRQHDAAWNSGPRRRLGVEQSEAEVMLGHVRSVLRGLLRARA